MLISIFWPCSSSLEDDDEADTANDIKRSTPPSRMKYDARGNKPSSSQKKDLPSQAYLSKLMEGL